MGNGNSKWNNSIGSDARLNAMTHLSGTTSERTAMTDWPTGMPFYDTDLKKWYKNAGTQLSPSSTEIGAEGSAYDICYQLSITIGDYTLTPASATATSEGTSPTDLDFDFSSSTGWTLSGSHTISGNVLNWYGSNSDNTGGAYYDMGVALNNSDFTVRMKLVISNFSHAGNGRVWYCYLQDSTAVTGDGGASRDSIGFGFWTGSSNIWAVDSDGASPPFATSGDGSAPIGTGTHYIQIKRTSTTAYTVKGFTDGTFTTESWSITGTCASTTTGLRYIMFTGRNNGSAPGGSLDGTVDDLTIDSPNTTTHSASNTYDGSTSTYWKSQSESNPAIYWDFSSNRKFISFAINLNTTDTTVSTMELSLSTDTTFSGEVKRTLAESDFTNNTWRYILINIQQTDTRYVQLKGSGTGVLSVYEFKARATTDTSPGFSHFHRVISTTLTSASSNDSN